MNNNEKHEFLSVMTKIADLYDKKIPKDRVAVYWDALCHRDINDVKMAINKHIQDGDRGRFFPLPADISYQLPNEQDAWLTADEAWATVPKSESDSAAMCDETASALLVANDLINNGDMIAARRAFIDHYNRLVDQAKHENRKPKWFPSYGSEKETRYIADSQIVERNNLMLPQEERKALPTAKKQAEYKSLQNTSAKTDPVKVSEIMAELKNILKKS